MRITKGVLAVIVAATATPAMAQESDLGGFFVGGFAGADIASVEVAGDDVSETGAVFGVTAGYDAVAGDAILGLEVEASDTTLGDDFGDAGLDLYGGLRVGLQVDEKGIVYLKGGYTTVDTDLATGDLDGFRIGAGYERSFGNLFGRLEYRYSNYSDDGAITTDINYNRNQIVLVVGGKF